MTIEEKTFIKAKLKGKSNSAAAMIAKPHIKKSSAGNIGMRLSKKVDNELQRILRNNGITLKKAIKPIGDALVAEKIDYKTGEVSIDHSIRLKAAGMALDLLNIKKADDTQPINNEALNKAIKNGDEVELQRILFNKNHAKTTPVLDQT